MGNSYIILITLFVVILNFDEISKSTKEWKIGK